MLKHWLWFAHLNGINDHLKQSLLERFGSPEMIYKADAESFKNISGMTPGAMKALRNKSLEFADAIEKKCAGDDIQILKYTDTEYPERLRNIYDPPMILYYRGKLPIIDSLPLIGIVGTRNASAYGLTTAGRLGAEITKCGGTVVSGMAAGIDKAATIGALESGGAPVGVLGCGINLVYPSGNKQLYSDTVQKGCIISEYPPDMQPQKWTFPKRNRIISGLSCGVVVVEAPLKSGALITADCALNQGRSVYAVPGNVDLTGFAGSNRLLREGALYAGCGWDIMQDFRHRFPDIIKQNTESVQKNLHKENDYIPCENTGIKIGKSKNSNKEKSDTEQKKVDNSNAAPYIDIQNVLNKLTASEKTIAQELINGERFIDDVIADSGLPSEQVLRIMTILEIRGIIIRLPGRKIALKR